MKIRSSKIEKFIKDDNIKTTFEYVSPLTPTTILFLIEPQNKSYPMLKKDLSLN